MDSLWGIALAGAGVLGGLLWQLPWGRSRDLACFQTLNHLQIWAGFDRMLIFLRSLGTKWALMLFIGVVLVWDVELGISLTLAALLMAAIERGIKFLIKRPRPFVDHPGVIVRQNPEPKDPSFPSGDATRVWFILAALLFGIRPALFWIILTIGCVAVVSLGRVRLGVHYPLDVFGGAGLGFGFGMIWSSIIL
jgi:undecaprenyl-diphosphatase